MMDTNLLKDIGFILKETFLNPFKDTVLNSQTSSTKKPPKNAEFAGWSANFNLESDTSQNDKIQKLSNIIQAQESKMEILETRIEALEKENSTYILRSKFKVVVWCVAILTTVTFFLVTVYFSGESELAGMEKRIFKASEYLFTMGSSVFIALIVGKATAK
jgi:hypothetical protein